MPFKVAILIGTALAAATPAAADGLVMPPAQYSENNAYASQSIEQPWAQQRVEPSLTERPVAELIAARLGLAEGSAELFRYHLENAPSNATVLDGVIDGGGVQLKLTW
ncbi:MAG TPA: hypothetical protein VNU97_17510 [Rhizomicrobium sp.]|nr:hypothetical protein [Rhizomicrobium sp.]